MAGHTAATLQIAGAGYTIDRYADAAGPATRPVVVFLHGTDGLAGESGVEIGKFAGEIAAQGFLVFVPHYFGADNASGMPEEELFLRRIQAVSTYSPRIAAFVDFASTQAGADGGRVGLVGMSLGGGLALEYAESVPRGKVKAVVDYFGYVPAGSRIHERAARLPPTLIFHNKKDQVVDPSNSTSLRDALKASGVVHECELYDDDYAARRHHPFRPGGRADTDSRARTRAWLGKYVAP